MTSGMVVSSLLVMLLLGTVVPGTCFFTASSRLPGSSMEGSSRRRESCTQGVSSAFQEQKTSSVVALLPTVKARCCSRSSTAVRSSPRQVTAEELETEMTEWNLPMILDVFATWCGPCHDMKPEIDKVAKALEGRCRVLKMDTDDEEAMSSVLQVYGLPTVLYMKDGEIKHRTEGAMPAEEVLRLADIHLFDVPSADELSIEPTEAASACKPLESSATSEP